jgi:hypothetical protein
VEHLLGSDGRERDDRIAELDRQPREPQPLLPHQLVALASAFEDLSSSTREHQDILPVAHQSADVLARAAHHPAHGQQIAPHRDGMVRVLTERADRDPPARP